MNSISIDTKIGSLYECGRLSLRAYNCLDKAGMQTVRDIFEFMESTGDLLRLRNLGAKSFDEILSVLTEVSTQYGATPNEVSQMLALSMDGKLGELLQEAFVSLFPEETDVTRYFRSIYPDVLSLHKAVMDPANSLLLYNPVFSHAQNVALRKMTLRYLALALQRMSSKGMSDKQVYTNYLQRNATLPEASSFSRSERYSFFFTPDQRQLLSLMYEDLKVSLSTRAVNVIDKLGWSISSFIGLMEQDRLAYSVDSSVRYMTVSMNELYAFNQLFKKEFDRCWSMGEDECALAIIRHEYPGFSEADYHFIRSHQVQYGCYPRFFLLYTYLCRTEVRCELVYGLRYGIRTGRDCDLPSLAMEFGLTQERVRQLCEGRMPVCATELIQSEDWKHYESLFSLPYLTDGTPEWLALRERERLPLGLEPFHKLLALLGVRNLDSSETKSVKVPKRTSYPYEFVNLYGVGVVVNRLVLPSLDILALAKQLKQFVEDRHEADTWYDLNRLLVGVPRLERPMAQQLLATVVREVWHLSVDDKGRVLVPQNCVNLEKALVKILEKKGEPMSFEEISESFKALHPTYKYCLSFIRSTLVHSEAVRAIGKTGMYGLSRWGHVYFGSIRDALVDLLSAEADPLPLPVIVERIKKVFPSTNLKSIRQTMEWDVKGRFVKFKGSFFGVSTKQYDERFTPYEQIKLRGHFQECLTAFQSFVESEQHFPFCNGTADERFLYRWYMRIKRAYVHKDKSHTEFLRKVVKRYDERHIPRNKMEFNFKGLCDAYLSFVKREGALPEKGTDQALWDWFQTTLPLYGDWQDNRRVYFEALLQQLRTLGFAVDRGD